MNDLAYRAMVFAMDKHKDQKRKYTGEPYCVHLAAVAGIVSTVYSDEVTISIAWLHDCIEDCDVAYMDLFNRFGGDVADGVWLLSDLEMGNRAERKAQSRDRLSECDSRIQTIKVADLINNTSSIVQHDEKFAKIYLEEKRLLLDVLTKADARLVSIARQQCSVVQ